MSAELFEVIQVPEHESGRRTTIAWSSKWEVYASIAIGSPSHQLTYLASSEATSSATFAASS
jgi:hypothetical protein